MRKDLKYFLILFSVLLVFVMLELSKPQPINWTLTFSKNDKIPFGNFVLYDLIHTLFPESDITVSYKTVFENFQDWDIKTESRKGDNYLFINNEFIPDDLDTELMLDYVYQGNSVFIAANRFKGALADSLKIETKDYLFTFTDSTLTQLQTDSIGFAFVNASFSDSKSYYYNAGTVPFYFASIDTTTTTIAAINNYNHPVLVKIKHGKGNFILCSAPLAFSNFYVLQGQNAQFIASALSFLYPGNIIWDEYYKVGRGERKTPLRFILGKSSLTWAYGMTMFGLILFIAFEAKRKQRIIPIIKPPGNASLDFISTIGRLYFQHGNHKDLAEKKITYFLEHLRSVFYLRTSELGEEFTERFSEKTGYPLEDAKKLFRLVDEIKTSTAISEATLQKLNAAIEDFNEFIR